MSSAHAVHIWCVSFALITNRRFLLYVLVFISHGVLRTGDRVLVVSYSSPPLFLYPLVAYFVPRCLLCATEVKRNVATIDKAVSAKDMRLLSRVLRGTTRVRHGVAPAVLASLVRSHVMDSDAKKEALAALTALPSPASTSDADVGMDVGADVGTDAPSSPCTPESGAYLLLLAVMLTVDHRKNAGGSALAVRVADALVAHLSQLNRRTLDALSARAFFFYARAHELAGSHAAIRPQLLVAYRSATLRRDVATQATVLNALLRNYISFRLYDQADKLLSRAPFPETRSNNQLARHLFYVARVKAVQLDYSEALTCLQQAARKAPQKGALGFRTHVAVMAVVVQLLTGDIPDRSTFRVSEAPMREALAPYLRLTAAVRVGDMSAFVDTVEQCGASFDADGTRSLIGRLRHNVLKTGLRKLSASYSRISLADVAERLLLPSAAEAEAVVAKAIRDGVTEATIDHEGGWMRSTDVGDVYGGPEPSDAYHTRVTFCLNIYNEAVRALRFADGAAEEESVEALRARLKEEQELAQAIADGEVDDEDDGDDY